MNANEKDIAYALRRQSEAARTLLASLSSDDDTLNHDMVEGETDLLEALTAAITEMDESEIIKSGCADRIATYEDRKRQADKRIERIRGLIEQALAVAKIPTVRLPLATITLKATNPKPIYEDEASIPARFWKPSAPSLDKSEIAKAIAAGEEVPGVSLSNGGISLQIRRK